MITMTLEELIAINGLLDQKAIEGIIIKPSTKSEAERLENINESLTKKGLLIEGQLTDTFLATTELLKRYKASDKKIFINNLRIALVDEAYAIVLELLPNDAISFSYVPRITILKKYIEASHLLKQEQKPTFFSYDITTCTTDEYKADLDRKTWTNLMVIQTYIKGRLSKYLTYYFDEEEAYCFNHLKKTKQQRGANDFRLDLAQLLDEEEEQADETNLTIN